MLTNGNTSFPVHKSLVVEEERLWRNERNDWLFHLEMNESKSLKCFLMRCSRLTLTDGTAHGNLPTHFHTNVGVFILGRRSCCSSHYLLLSYLFSIIVKVHAEVENSFFVFNWRGGVVVDRFAYPWSKSHKGTFGCGPSPLSIWSLSSTIGNITSS